MTLFCLITNFQRSSSLDSYILRSTLSPEERHLIAGSVLDGQRHLIEQNVFHSDIKESNVLLDIHSNKVVAAVLCDFGVSTFKGSKNLGSTPCFEAPEMISGPEREPDELSEIWSTGLLVLKVSLHPPRDVWADDTNGTRPLLALYPKTLSTVKSEGLKNLVTSMLYPDRSLRCNMTSAITMFNGLTISDFR